jgi:hypothetical protein
MSIHELTRSIELNFWKTVIPIMGEKGIIMKFMQSLYCIIHSKLGYLLLLIIIWGGVGFTAGLLFGRLLILFNLI